ncbi:MAG: glycosyltransferase family 2 protein [Caulobacterales bacterium]
MPSMLAKLDQRSLCPAQFLRLEPAPHPSRMTAPRLRPWHLKSPGSEQSAPQTPRVSLVIPTQRRLRGLAAAARSTFIQAGVDPAHLELVIVDNDETPSARPVADALTAQAPFPIHYVHEPRPGVANARNAGLAKASGALIAFLDDDEIASEDWLAALMETQARFDADVVFGPVRLKAAERLGDHGVYLEQFFSREGPGEAGVIAHYYGCGDSLVRRAALPNPQAPFCTSRNHTGGEDDHLFGTMKERGARFAWTPKAVVYESPSPERLTLGYALARAFVYGQGPTFACATANPPDRRGVARWMALGALQACVFGLMAAVHWLLRAPHRAFTLDRAARGLGKLLWWGPFKLHFYGRPAAQAGERPGVANPDDRTPPRLYLGALPARKGDRWRAVTERNPIPGL